MLLLAGQLNQFRSSFPVAMHSSLFPSDSADVLRALFSFFRSVAQQEEKILYFPFQNITYLKSPIYQNFTMGNEKEMAHGQMARKLVSFNIGSL